MPSSIPVITDDERDVRREWRAGPAPLELQRAAGDAIRGPKTATLDVLDRIKRAAEQVAKHLRELPKAGDEVTVEDTATGMPFDGKVVYADEWGIEVIGPIIREGASVAGQDPGARVMRWTLTWVEVDKRVIVTARATRDGAR